MSDNTEEQIYQMLPRVKLYDISENKLNPKRLEDSTSILTSRSKLFEREKVW